MKSFEQQLKETRDLLREWLSYCGGQGHEGDYTLRGELERKTKETLSFPARAAAKQERGE